MRGAIQINPSILSSPRHRPTSLWRGLAFTLPLMLLGGCGHDASLQQETPTGGLVTFPIQSEQDVLTSDGRHDALRLMRDKCPTGVHIVKEGPVPKVSRAADRAWGAQLGTDRLWGIQFTCK